MNCTRLIWRKWIIYPILQNRNCTLYKIVGAARNWINSVPQIEATTFAFSSMTTTNQLSRNQHLHNSSPGNSVSSSTFIGSMRAQRFYSTGLGLKLLGLDISREFHTKLFLFSRGNGCFPVEKSFFLLQFHENFKQQKLMNIFNIIIFLWSYAISFLCILWSI